MLKDLDRWIAKCTAEASYSVYLRQFEALRDLLVAAGGAHPEVEKAARKLIRHAEDINPQYVVDIARIRQAAGMPPLHVEVEAPEAVAPPSDAT